MSLNWSLENVENGQELASNMDATTESIIWYTMLIGMPSITEDNAVEFYKRVAFYEKLFGSNVYHIDENNNRVSDYITIDDINKHIGLRTNASTITATKYRNHIVQQFFKEIEPRTAKSDS